MMARVRDWLEETHGDTFELVRHFLARFFDNEIGARSDDWHKVAVGVFATVVSLGLLVFQVYQARFRILQDPVFSTRPLYQTAVREDFLSLLAITMAITALLTLLQWQSLFPSLRDYMALTGFPVSARQIFTAKFGALVLVFAAFVISLTLPLAGFFGWAIRGNWQENPSNPADHGRRFRRPRRRQYVCLFCVAGPARRAAQHRARPLVSARFAVRASRTVHCHRRRAAAFRTPAAKCPMVASGLVQASLGSHRHSRSHGARIGATRPPGNYPARAARDSLLSAQLPPLSQAADRSPAAPLRWKLVRDGVRASSNCGSATRANRPPSPSPGRHSGVAAFTASCFLPTPASRSAG